MKMKDQNLKTEWVKALRSGDFRQGQSWLCRLDETGPRYCCLGVLCEIMGVNSQSKIVERAVSCEVKEYHFESEDEEAAWETGQPIDGWFAELLSGFAEEDDLSPSAQAGKEMVVLVDMNDGNKTHQCSFSEIADYIEANL